MLEIDSVTRRFGDVLALDKVSFGVPDGQLIGFVGGNGAGKTTTMRVAMGVLAAHGGQVRWQGREVTALDRRRFGYMPEERGLYPKQPIIDQLVYLGQLHGLGARTARADAAALLERFGLGDRRRDKLESLSLGNQQRVQIAAAMMAEPQLLILDEPFSGLDPAAVDAMVQLLRERTAAGVPVLFSSHQLDLVERLSDALVILHRGRVVAQGTATALRGAGPERYRLVLGGDAGWLRGLPGITVVDVDGPRAVLELTSATSDDVLRVALQHGSVRELAQVTPTLAEVYRDATNTSERSRMQAHDESRGTRGLA